MSAINFNISKISYIEDFKNLLDEGHSPNTLMNELEMQVASITKKGDEKEIVRLIKAVYLLYRSCNGHNENWLSRFSKVCSSSNLLKRVKELSKSKEEKVVQRLTDESSNAGIEIVAGIKVESQRFRYAACFSKNLSLEILQRVCFYVEVSDSLDPVYRRDVVKAVTKVIKEIDLQDLDERAQYYYNALHRTIGGQINNLRWEDQDKQLLSDTAEILSSKPQKIIVSYNPWELIQDLSNYHPKTYVEQNGSEEENPIAESGSLTVDQLIEDFQKLSSSRLDKLLQPIAEFRRSVLDKFSFLKSPTKLSKKEGVEETIDGCITTIRTLYPLYAHVHDCLKDNVIYLSPRSSFYQEIGIHDLRAPELPILPSTKDGVDQLESYYTDYIDQLRKEQSKCRKEMEMLYAYYCLLWNRCTAPEGGLPLKNHFFNLLDKEAIDQTAEILTDHTNFSTLLQVAKTQVNHLLFYEDSTLEQLLHTVQVIKFIIEEFSGAFDDGTAFPLDIYAKGALIGNLITDRIALMLDQLQCPLMEQRFLLAIGPLSEKWRTRRLPRLIKYCAKKREQGSAAELKQLLEACSILLKNHNALSIDHNLLPLVEEIERLLEAYSALPTCDLLFKQRVIQQLSILSTVNPELRAFIIEFKNRWWAQTEFPRELFNRLTYFILGFPENNYNLLSYAAEYRFKDANALIVALKEVSGWLKQAKLTENDTELLKRCLPKISWLEIISFEESELKKTWNSYGNTLKQLLAPPPDNS